MVATIKMVDGKPVATLVALKRWMGQGEGYTECSMAEIKELSSEEKKELCEELGPILVAEGATVDG
jgi:antitoxin (DNA-binding transcriptional repressor) of toxin-antitoxin stability system